MTYLELALKEIRRILKPNGIVILSGPTESWFYKLCRLIWLGYTNAGYHVHTVYDIEKKFEKSNFRLVKNELAIECKNPSELADTVRRSFSSNFHSQEKINDFFTQFLYKPDGRASERLCDAIESLVKKDRLNT